MITSQKLLLENQPGKENRAEQIKKITVMFDRAALSARGPSRQQFPKTDLRAAFGSAFVEKSQNAVPPGPSQPPDKIPPKTKIFCSFF